MIVDHLRQDGIARAPAMPKEKCRAFVEHLQGCKVYNAHVAAKADHFAAFEDAAILRWPMFCCSMEDLILAPHFFEHALATYHIARAYFGERPRLYSMNVFWTQKSERRYEDTHSWHRDGDDRKQLVLFMYGSDVTATDDGVHLYQRGTHRIADDKLGWDFRNPPPRVIETVDGEAGTCFFTDTSGLHMGLRPNRGRRMLAWARWGVSNPPESYVWDKLAPIAREKLRGRYPDDLALQESIRLVVA